MSAALATSATLPGLLKNALNKLIVMGWQELGRIRWFPGVTFVQLTGDLLRATRWTALSPFLDPADGTRPMDRMPLAAPFHGAIQVEDFQLVLLLKALRMPRVALLLAYGNTLAEAAQEMGIAEIAARNYSKKIYGKMGIAGQADLIRLTLRSIAFLRQPPARAPNLKGISGHAQSTSWY